MTTTHTTIEHQSRVRIIALMLSLLVTGACTAAVPGSSEPNRSVPASVAEAVPAATPQIASAPADNAPVAQSGTGAQEVRIGMAYIPNVQFAPFYVADAKGYFAAEGIKPVYDYGFEQDVIALTAEGKLTFTNAGASTVIAARSRGVPVKYFIKEYQSMPIAIFTTKE